VSFIADSLLLGTLRKVADAYEVWICRE